MSERQQQGGDVVTDLAGEQRPPSLDLRTDLPHPARMYDYYLGGKDNFPSDRAAAAQVVKLLPSTPAGCRANRRFLGRAVRLAVDRGIRQFLDIGTGIPTADNTHEVAQAAAPEARVVYVDNDPIVLAHARALLTSSPQGRTAYVDADFRDPDAVLAAPAVRDILDFDQPVALLTVALLHFFQDADGPYELVRRYQSALPSGSVHILSHGTGETMDPAVAESVMRTYAEVGLKMVSRTKAEVERFFPGWELVEPGVAPVNRWRADGNPEDLALSPAEAAGYGVVAVKP
ncbi:SAM-dependent methyltransferase [Phaeacidiphilus oryzae]|uniref:SAM-dependent methyltransferase n=1 Tax=Phaeacidiphilus oryzae TaxID=348818 RepID=UPI00068EB593|nr:SAM-dependent methyltransferase [Phaeacidiphilus oryzae]